jgi:hypothetical protein
MLEAKITTFIFKSSLNMLLLDTQGVSGVLECGLPSTDTFKISNEENAACTSQGCQITTIPGHMS